MSSDLQVPFQTRKPGARRYTNFIVRNHYILAPGRETVRETSKSCVSRSNRELGGLQKVGVASGSVWNLWVWLLGVVVRRYIDFLILFIPTPLVSVLLQQHRYFLFI